MQNFSCKDSKSGGRKVVGVQVPPPAPFLGSFTHGPAMARPERRATATVDAVPPFSITARSRAKTPNSRSLTMSAETDRRVPRPAAERRSRPPGRTAHPQALEQPDYSGNIRRFPILSLQVLSPSVTSRSHGTQNNEPKIMLLLFLYFTLDWQNHIIPCDKQ